MAFRQVMRSAPVLLQIAIYSVILNARIAKGGRALRCEYNTSFGLIMSNIWRSFTRVSVRSFEWVKIRTIRKVAQSRQCAIKKSRKHFPCVHDNPTISENWTGCSKRILWLHFISLEHALGAYHEDLMRSNKLDGCLGGSCLVCPIGDSECSSFCEQCRSTFRKCGFGTCHIPTFFFFSASNIV